MNERDLAVAKMVGTEAAERGEAAGLLGLWHFGRKEYAAAFAAFSTALAGEPGWGFLAAAAWRAEWGAKGLPDDFAQKAPLAAAGFWAWAGKGVEGLAALGKSEPGTLEKVRAFLAIYLELLSLPPGPSRRPAEFRDRLEGMVKAEYGTSSDRTRRLLSLYDSGELAALATELRSLLERFFWVPPFTSVDFLWLMFLSGEEKLDFSSLSSALAELDSLPEVPLSGWKERKRAAGQLLLFSYLLRAGLESFEKALKINPKFEKAFKNAQLVNAEKPELADWIKQFPVV